MKGEKQGVVLVCMLLLLIPLVSMSPAVTEDASLKFVDINNLSYTEHDPIFITSDSDFVAQGYPGSGTEVDPYVIEGLSITADFECISIMNTNAWYVIRDCVFDSEATVHNNMYDAGVYIEYGSNGLIEDCIIYHKGTGVIAFNSENFTMRNNQVIECETGLRLLSWDNPPIGGNSEISNNYIVNCNYAIGVEGISDVLVADNIIESCWDGIIVAISSSIFVENNTLSDIDNSGINVHESTGCFIVENDISVGLVGIQVERAPNNHFINNHLVGGGFIIDTWETNEEHLHQDMSGNTVDGLPVGYFWDLSDSLIDGTPYGQIILVDCNNVTLENGIFSNVGFGISIWFSQQITIRNVQVIDNFQGVGVKFCYDVTIEDSTIRDNIFGITFSNIDTCAIFHCVFQNNYIGALTEVYVYSLTVEDSTFIDNFGGLSLRATPLAIVRNNSFENGSLFIDYDSWYSSHWEHTIVGNTVNGKELGYFFGASDLNLDGSDYGQLILANCINVAIIGGEFSGVTAGIQIAYSSACSIENVQFRDIPFGIMVSDSDQCHITDSIFDHITKMGIYLDGDNHTVSGIEACHFVWSNRPSMYISSFPSTSLLMGSSLFIESTWDSDFIEIYDNTIENAFDAMRLSGYNHRVYNNTLRDCNYGISVYSSEVFNNELYNVYYGISVCGEDCKIYGNIIQGGYEGLQLFSSPDVEVYNNTLQDITYGLSISSTTDAYIHDNILSNTTFKVRGYSIAEFRHRVENNYIDGKLVGYFWNLTDTTLDASLYGIMILTYSENVTIENGVFAESQIYLEWCSYCKVVNNTITNVFSNAVYLSNSDNCKVIDNNLLNCGTGIYLIRSPYTEIRGNTILDSNLQGIFSILSPGCTIERNVIEDSVYYGIHLNYRSDNFIILNNTLGGCLGVAIDISLDPYFLDRGFQLGDIIGNNVTNNPGIGINIGPRVTNLTIHSNVIASNELGNANDDGMFNQWDNGLDTGNGWSDYSGIGFYEIPGSASSVDRFPERIGGLVPPSLSSPDDFSYEFGSTNNMVEWDVIAEYGVTYDILIDGTPLSSGTWNPGDGAISTLIDNLAVGTYEFGIYVVGDGGEVSDVVQVSVIDTTPPEWTEIPVDQTIEIWQSFYYDVNASDLSGIASYWINDTINFDINSDGIVIATALEVGVYGLEIRAYDPYGNYCSIEIQVTIEDSYDGLEVYLIGILLQIFPWLPYPAIVAMARRLVKLWIKKNT
ncbi:MAG: right-handed parallel beta-helix repeat-containing protein [Candidatus Thorarchaeota archaeon]